MTMHVENGDPTAGSSKPTHGRTWKWLSQSWVKAFNCQLH